VLAPTETRSAAAASEAALARAATALAAATDDAGRRAALGLLGDAALALTAPPGPRLPPGPLEAWSFRAGIKPVAFLTVEADREAVTRAAFGDAHVERRERNVAIGAHDRWLDDRRSGAPRVELYVAGDADLARRAAALQLDPTRNLVELGALMGYPPCCVAAFGAQRDRANNSLNRYRAAARTPPGSAPWPWPLNELQVRLVPFFPCSYRCQAALAFATATLAALDGAHPGTAAQLEAHLAQTVLYLDHDHQHWTRAAVTLTDDTLAIGDDRWQRTEPALGFVARFA